MVDKIQEGDKLLVTAEFKDLYPTSNFKVGDELTARYSELLGKCYGFRSDGMQTLLVHGDVDLRMKQAWKSQQSNG